MVGMGKAMPKGSGLIIPTECEVRIGHSAINDEIRSKSVPEVTAFLQNEVLALR
jgi:hypothetical protein